jgi:hypothetical protein
MAVERESGRRICALRVIQGRCPGGADPSPAPRRLSGNRRRLDGAAVIFFPWLVHGRRIVLIIHNCI